MSFKQHVENLISCRPQSTNVHEANKHLSKAILDVDRLFIPKENHNSSNLWKHATIIPIPKPNKNHNIGTNYQPISLLSPIAKTLEKTLLPYITENIPMISYQYGFKHKHSTHTALHNICHQITKSFNISRPLPSTVAVALDMSKAFDTINIHKLTLTNIPNIIIKFIADKRMTRMTSMHSTHWHSFKTQMEYHKVEFCLQHYSTFTLLTLHSVQKMYKSQHMVMT